MANEIRIHPSSEWLVRGKAVRVPITVALEVPLKVRGIHATFRGGEETKAVYQSGKHQHTAVETIEVIKQEFLLAGNEKLGVVGNVNDAAATLFGGGKHDTLQAGEYKYEVEIAVPTDAPPTHAGKKSRVFYELTVGVDVPLGRDLKAKQSFHVGALDVSPGEIAPVVVRYPEDGGRGALDSLLGPDVKIEMALAANQFRSGETIVGIVSIDSPKEIQCRALRARLVGHESSQAKGHKDSHQHKMPAVEIAQPGTIQGSYTKEFSISAEASSLSARGTKFSIDWFVQIEFDVPWAKNPKVKAPITVLPAAKRMDFLAADGHS